MNLIDKDEYGVKVKYQDRTCSGCNRYPCFTGIDKCHSNFASYGCIYYIEKRSNEWL